MQEIKEITVTLRVLLDEEQQEKLAEYAALRREYDVACFPGKGYSEERYTDEATLEHILGVAFSDDMLNEAINTQKRILEHRQKIGSVQLRSERDRESGDVPTRNPSPDEPEQEAETVPNAEEAAPVPPVQASSYSIEDIWELYAQGLEAWQIARKISKGLTLDQLCTESARCRKEGFGLLATELDELIERGDEMEEYNGYAYFAVGDGNGEFDMIACNPSPEEAETVSNAEEGASADGETRRYEDDAYESGGRIVLENPEALAFVDALSAALCR